MEKHSKSGTSGMFIPCDFCNERTAVLYCRADSARLCLFCDQHVHSANALSLKHLRSQICDNCRSEPVSVRCYTDNLVLCGDCDSDTHDNCSVSSLHRREPVQDFSGCPSAIELALVWGFHLQPRNSINSNNYTRLYKSDVGNFQDLMVINEEDPLPDGVPSLEFPTVSNLRNSSCGKYKTVMYKQLMELAKRETVRVNGDGSELGSGIEFDNGDDEELLHQQTPFTSLLMLPTTVDSRENDCVNEVDNMWNCNPTYQAPQIWDFHLGKSRDCEEDSQQEVGYGAENPGFTIKYYNDIGREASLTTAEVLQNMNEMKCFTTYNGIPVQKDFGSSDATSSDPDALAAKWMGIDCITQNRMIQVDSPLLWSIFEHGLFNEPVPID
ncbi:zinc finger protein CONSTANS-LIKE 15-like isoform X2 [Cornus florida]|uniref:zinc finger protein CONSTANS-LIKE 15-like isoform X2 n=1 Tax=Cornus florida TaxID=4283 RepID=UPI0028A0E894|nr:zinc finger protein CONSTANS-LIKE 15-like isoform X2 [Cornus florida]